MERRGDFLSFSERRHNDGARLRRSTFLVFSTNLHPADLGDEAPAPHSVQDAAARAVGDEFIRIFEAFCTARKLPFTRDLIMKFIGKQYRRTAKVFRRCHPRDVLSHALNLIHFEKLPFALTEESPGPCFRQLFPTQARTTT